MSFSKCLLLFSILTTGGFAQSYTVQTFAGGGEPYNENALTAHLSTPTNLVRDQRGGLYVSLNNYSIVVRIQAGKVTRIAGNGKQGFNGDNGRALDAELSGPAGVAVDSKGNVYIYDALNTRVRKVDATTGIITTVAGGGAFSVSLTVGGPATALYLPRQGEIAVDRNGELYISIKCRIIKVDSTTGLTSSIAGNGQCSLSGDGGPATSASLTGDQDNITFDSSGNLYIADANLIRKIDAVTGTIDTIAGGGTPTDMLGDGGPATSAELSTPTGLAVDSRNDLFIADSYACRIRKVDSASGIIVTIAGTGVSGYTGDGGKATAAEIGNQLDVAVDTAGNAFIADRSWDRVRRVDAVTGIITNYAGDGPQQFSGDGNLAIYSQMQPLGVAFDSHGNAYIADNNRIRKVEAATGIINTVAGNGASGFSGDGGPATKATIGPAAVAVDTGGNIFIADTTNNRVRRVDVATGIITTFAGGGGIDSDHGPATSLKLFSATAIAVDQGGNVFVADSQVQRVYKINRITGMMMLVAGTFGLKTGSDGGPGTSAPLKNPQGLAAWIVKVIFLSPIWTIAASGASTQALVSSLPLPAPSAQTMTQATEGPRRLRNFTDLCPSSLTPMTISSSPRNSAM